MVRGLERALKPLKQRVMLTIGRAMVLLVNDALKLQGLQVSLLADEVRDDVERFQQYGFTSHPHAGAEAIAACVGGSRDHVVVLAIDDRRYRLKSLAQGEVAIYTDEGDTVVLKRGRIVEITAGTELKITAPTVTINATTKVQVNGPLLQVTGGDVKADTIALKTHVHGGVTVGAANTGAPA